MARSVQITTPIPSLKEFGESLGLSKRRQDSLIRLVKGDKTSRGLDDRHRDSVRASYLSQKKSELKRKQ